MLAIVNDHNWYMDIGATNHITSDLNKLTLKIGYKNKEKLVGNGNSLKICHIGSSTISSNFSSQPVDPAFRLNAFPTRWRNSILVLKIDFYLLFEK